MKNILIIQGGGRPNGNTSQLVNSFMSGAKECGHTVELISLLKNEVKGCLGCNACRYGKPCIQKDSFNDLVPKIKNADCIVLVFVKTKNCGQLLFYHIYRFNSMKIYDIVQ